MNNDERDSLGRKYSEAVATARQASIAHNRETVVGRLHAPDGSWVWKTYAATGPASREAHQEIRDDGKRWEPMLKIERARRW